MSRFTSMPIVNLPPAQPRATYADLQTRGRPAGLAPGSQWDPFDAAPMMQTDQGLVQQRNADGTRQLGQVPATLYGGLLDTRYTKGMEQMFDPTPAARAAGVVGPPTPAIDTDLSTGVPEYDRRTGFDTLTQALNELGIAQDQRVNPKLAAAKSNLTTKFTNKLQRAQVNAAKKPGKNTEASRNVAKFQDKLNNVDAILAQQRPGLVQKQADNAGAQTDLTAALQQFLATQNPAAFSGGQLNEQLRQAKTMKQGNKDNHLTTTDFSWFKPFQRAPLQG